jgi:hypothetical protein
VFLASCARNDLPSSASTRSIQAQRYTICDFKDFKSGKDSLSIKMSSIPDIDRKILPPFASRSLLNDVRVVCPDVGGSTTLTSKSRDISIDSFSSLVKIDILKF